MGVLAVLCTDFKTPSGNQPNYQQAPQVWVPQELLPDFPEIWQYKGWCYSVDPDGTQVSLPSGAAVLGSQDEYDSCVLCICGLRNSGPGIQAQACQGNPNALYARNVWISTSNAPTVPCYFVDSGGGAPVCYFFDPTTPVANIPSDAVILNPACLFASCQDCISQLPSCYVVWESTFDPASDSWSAPINMGGICTALPAGFAANSWTQTSNCSALYYQLVRQICDGNCSDVTGTAPPLPDFTLVGTCQSAAPGPSTSCADCGTDCPAATVNWSSTYSAGGGGGYSGTTSSSTTGAGCTYSGFATVAGDVDISWTLQCNDEDVWTGTYTIGGPGLSPDIGTQTQAVAVTCSGGNISFSATFGGTLTGGGAFGGQPWSATLTVTTA
jgi:hypothetical protein